MAISRFAASFRRQDWAAVAVEFTSVTAGVLLGVQASNWNDERRHQTQVREVVARLLPEFRKGAHEQPYLQKYYANREMLGRRAEQLWNQQGHDDEFLKAAYLTGGYALVPDFDRYGSELRIGPDTISQIDDSQLRDSVASLLGQLNDEYLRFSYIDSDYRRTVRRIVSSDLQDKLGRLCNSAPKVEDLRKLYSAPCSLSIPADVVRELSSKLRSSPVALGQLREHINRLQAINARIEALGPLYRDALEAIGENDHNHMN